MRYVSKFLPISAFLLCLGRPLAAQDMSAEQHSLYVPGVSGAQMEFRTVIEANPLAAGNVYMMYDLDSPRPKMNAPKGYRPFYISHYGRHGSRYILHNKMYDYPYSVFAKADSLGVLTDLGRKSWETWKRIYPSLKGRAGKLSADGELQQRTLAEQMYSSYKRVFRGNPHVEAVSSVVPRCIASMNAFAEGLLSSCKRLQVSTIANDSTMMFVNAYSPSTNPLMTAADRHYRSHGAWIRALDNFYLENVDMKGIVRRLFSDSCFIRDNVQLRDFVEDMYYVATGMPCTEFDDESFMDIFSIDDLCALSAADNYSYYLQKGRAPENGDYSQRLSSQLLDAILKTTISDLESGEFSVRLRFGHDGCIMGLFNTLGIGGWGTVIEGADGVCNLVHSFDVPMASNIQMVFYRSRHRDDDVLMTFLYNGYPVHLPVSEVVDGFYRWQDVRSWMEGVMSEYEK